MPDNNRFPIDPVCPLCNEPEELETAKTNADAKAFHEECYVDAVEAEQARPAKQA